MARGRTTAKLVNSQLGVNLFCLSWFGWCVREPGVNITLFSPLLLPEVMDVKQEVLRARQSTIVFILSLILSLQATVAAWARTLKL